MRATTRDECAADALDEPPATPICPIVDAHHHFFPESIVRANESESIIKKKAFSFGEAPLRSPYELDDLLQDVESHLVVATVYAECHSYYDSRHQSAPHLRCCGETRRVKQIFDAQNKNVGLGIVASVDLFGDQARVRQALETHARFGGRNFKGVRLSIAASDEELVYVPLTSSNRVDPDDARLRASLTTLTEMNLVLDVWLLDDQIKDLIRIAKAHPSLAIVADHCCMPLVVRDEDEPIVFAKWKADMRALSACPNVVVKIGGLAMNLTVRFPRRATSLDAQRLLDPWVSTCVELFSSARCMFESNFPMDKGNLSYSALVNGYKRMLATRTSEERRDVFFSTANRVYSLGLETPPSSAYDVNKASGL